jgi:uncharacterized OsmC-like protein
MSDTTSVYSTSLLAPPAVEPDAGFSLSIRLYADYEQIVDFKLPGVAILGLDECPPSGNGWGPSPGHLLAAALGACLGARLLSWLREQGVTVNDMRTDVRGSLARGADGRRRIARIAVRLSPTIQSTRPVAMIAPAELLRESLVAGSLEKRIDVQVSITPDAPFRPSDVAGVDAVMGRASTLDQWRIES